MSQQPALKKVNPLSFKPSLRSLFLTLKLVDCVSRFVFFPQNQKGRFIVYGLVINKNMDGIRILRCEVVRRLNSLQW